MCLDVGAPNLVPSVDVRQFSHVVSHPMTPRNKFRFPMGVVKPVGTPTLPPRAHSPHHLTCEVGEPDALPELPQFHIPGLKRWDIAPTNRATCMLCNSKMDKGTTRLSYRFRQSKAMEHVKQLHPQCCGLLPVATREVDRLALRHFLLKEIDADTRILFEHALHVLLA